MWPVFADERPLAGATTEPHRAKKAIEAVLGCRVGAKLERWPAFPFLLGPEFCLGSIEPRQLSGDLDHRRSYSGLAWDFWKNLLNFSQILSQLLCACNSYSAGSSSIGFVAPHLTAGMGDVRIH
jgi:hypothetical protein